MPFAQKGIVGNMFSSGPYMRTSNARVLTSQIADATAVSARRSLVIHSMRQEMIDNRDIVSQLLTWGGRKRVPSILKPVLASINPLYYEFRNLEYMSPAQPADALLRAIYHGIGTLHLPTLADAVMYSDVDLEDGLFTMRGVAEKYMSNEAWPEGDEDLDEMAKTNPRVANQVMRVMRNIWRRNPDIGTDVGWAHATDMFEFMGVTVGLLSDIPHAMDTKDYGKMGSTLVSVLFPGIYTKGLHVAGGLAWEYGLITQPAVGDLIFGDKPHGPAEMAPKSKGHAPYADRSDGFQRWAVRRALGIGTTPTQITDELGVHESGDLKVARRGALHKAYQRRQGFMSKGARERAQSHARDAWRRYTQTEDEEVKDEKLADFHDAVAKIEKLVGTESARSFYREFYPRRSWLPRTADGEPTDGLIAEEVRGAYDWIVEAMRLDESRRRKKKGTLYFTGPTGREYFTGDEEEED